MIAWNEKVKYTTWYERLQKQKRAQQRAVEFSTLKQIVVIDWQTQRVVYAGDSQLQAAMSLEPGKTFGKGRTEAEALQQAVDRSNRYLNAMIRAASRKPLDQL